MKKLDLRFRGATVKSLGNAQLRHAGEEAADLFRLAVELLEHARHGLGRAGDEQPAARLRIGDELLLPVGETGGELHPAPLALPVALGCAGGDALSCPV